MKRAATGARKSILANWEGPERPIGAHVTVYEVSE